MSDILNLDVLRPLYADEPEALVDLVRDAVRTSASLVERLEASTGAEIESAGHLAHELKGLCSTIGANEVASVAEEIESGAKSGNWDQIAARLGALRAAHERFVAAAAAMA